MEEGVALDHEFAGCGGEQSGQRFLDSSAPRLRRHASSCKEAGGDSHSLPAGKEEKLSWGFGGEAPNERAALGTFAEIPESPLSPLYPLGDFQMTSLIQFFQSLDRWDREFHSCNASAFEVTP